MSFCRQMFSSTQSFGSEITSWGCLPVSKSIITDSTTYMIRVYHGISCHKTIFRLIFTNVNPSKIPSTFVNPIKVPWKSRWNPIKPHWIPLRSPPKSPQKSPEKSIPILFWPPSPWPPGRCAASPPWRPGCRGQQRWAWCVRPLGRGVSF